MLYRDEIQSARMAGTAYLAKSFGIGNVDKGLPKMFSFRVFFHEKIAYTPKPELTEIRPWVLSL